MKETMFIFIVANYVKRKKSHTCSSEIVAGEVN